MKVNVKRLVLWLIIFVVWVGGISLTKYSIGLRYGADVATQQVDPYTNSYKVLKTQKTVNKVLNIGGTAVGLFFLVMAGRAFKFEE